MRNAPLVLACVSSFAIGASAFAESVEYRVESYSWCNGPVTDACSANSYWNGVGLGELKRVRLELTDTVQYVEFEDQSGHVWQKNLLECVQSPSDRAGCRASVKFPNPAQVSVSVSQWVGSDTSSQYFSFDLSDENNLAIFGPDNAYFVLDVAKAFSAR